MGNLQTYERPSGKFELIINGTVYDVTDFASKHPGGSIILNQLNPKNSGYPADATFAFEMLHGQSNRPLKVLKALTITGKSRSLTGDEIEIIKKKRPYDEKLSKSFKTATKILKSEGFFDYTVCHVILRQAELLSFLVFGWWCATPPGDSLDGGLVLFLWVFSCNV
jgi:hypothetical protein